MPPRTILHVDMDAFFASIEQLDHPELRGKPILVGSDRARGVVTTASYEARVYGCHSAQPMAVARRLCPMAIIVPTRGHRYREVSHEIFSILDEFSPLVEPVSIDEAFLDATGSERLLGPGRDLASNVKRRIQNQTGLTASVGVAPNKFLAKLASDLQKPDGLTVLGPHNIDSILLPLPVAKIWGIGPSLAEHLQNAGIKTIGDLRQASPETLEHLCGSEADRLGRLARGQDDRPVTPDSRAKSIGHEQTFEVDVADADLVRHVLLEQVEQVARRIRKHGLKTRTISLKIRFGQFQTISRSRTLEAPTDATDIIWHCARSLFDRWASVSFSPVRLIGVSASGLGRGPEQIPLFEDPHAQRQRRVDQTTDRIVERFGTGAIRRGGV